jgi:hypothetical protein
MTTPSEPTPTTSELSNPASSVTPSIQDPDLDADFSIPLDREFILITVALPDGGTTDPLPIKVDDLIFANLGNTRRYKLDWQKRIFTRTIDAVRNHLDSHDFDPDHAYLESLQALFYNPDHDIDFQYDKLIQMYYDPNEHKVPIWPSTLKDYLFHQMKQPTHETHFLHFRFLGRAQRLFKEACLPRTTLNISDPDNSPQLRSQFSELLREILVKNFSQQISFRSSSPSTPLTRNTTPTPNISLDASVLPLSQQATPSTIQPVNSPNILRNDTDAFADSPLLQTQQTNTESTNTTASSLLQNKQSVQSPKSSDPPAMHTATTLNPQFQLLTCKLPPSLLAPSVPTLPMLQQSIPHQSNVQRLQQPTPKQPPPQQYFQGRPVDVTQPPPQRSSISSFDPTAPNSTEPTWDEHQRDSYKYLKSPNDYLSRLPEPRPDKMVSNTWQHACF